MAKINPKSFNKFLKEDITKALYEADPPPAVPPADPAATPGAAPAPDAPPTPDVAGAAPDAAGTPPTAVPETTPPVDAGAAPTPDQGATTPGTEAAPAPAPVEEEKPVLTYDEKVTMLTSQLSDWGIKRVNPKIEGAKKYLSIPDKLTQQQETALVALAKEMLDFNLKIEKEKVGDFAYTKIFFEPIIDQDPAKQKLKFKAVFQKMHPEINLGAGGAAPEAAVPPGTEAAPPA